MVSDTTLGDDAPHVLSDVDIPFYAADMQCQENAVKLGIAGNLDFIIFPTETYWTYNANLRDFQVKNETAGADGKLIIIATVPNQYVEKALSQGFKEMKF